MNRKTSGAALLLVSIALLILASRVYRRHLLPQKNTGGGTTISRSSEPGSQPPITAQPNTDGGDGLRGIFRDTLPPSWASKRTINIPPPPKMEDVPDVAAPRPTLDSRAQGRKEREGLPMGVVLWNGVPVYEDKDGKKEIFNMLTGDMVRVFPDQADGFARVQPGLDVYLAATTKETQPAGERLPDRDGWVKKSDIRLFEPDDAREYIMELSPVTLGNDPDFSTLRFYERAMRNPDPVVHRVVGPRLIALVMLHEDYSTSWSALYRDRDPKIRDAALSALNERGLANNRAIIEDLIVRLTELTRTRAKGETELEAVSILNVLKRSGHPRVRAAVGSLKEAWKETQDAPINAAADEILSGQ